MSCQHPRTHISDSYFHGGGFSTADSKRILCDSCRLQRWLDIEVALAESQAEVGLIPAYAAVDIKKFAHLHLMNADAIRDGIAESGHSLISLIRELRKLCPDKSGQFIHYGATTQDIQDTGMALELKETLNILQQDMLSLMEILHQFVIENRDVIITGRTHAMPALPTTLGFKFSIYLDECNRHLQRIREAQSRITCAQIFGGVGTMNSFGKHGPQMLVSFANRLGLSIPQTCWHTSRDRIAEFGYLFSYVLSTFEKIANEVRTLVRPEIAEFDLVWNAAQVGSSTMPHKRNPENAEQVVVLSRLVRTATLNLSEATVQDHERDYRGTRLEWPALCSVIHYGLAGMKFAKNTLEGIRVNRKNIERNVNANKSWLCTEAFVFALGKKLGRQSAFELTLELSQSAINEGINFEQKTLSDPRVLNILSKEEIITSLTPYTDDCTQQLIDKVLAEYYTLKNADNKVKIAA